MSQQVGTRDNIMYKQAAFFGSAELRREADLAGPAPKSRAECRTEENLEALGGMRRPDRSVAKRAAYIEQGEALAKMAEKFID